jgi:hypothetical protein
MALGDGYGRVTITIEDFSREKSTFSYLTPPVGAASIAGIYTAAETVAAELADIIKGEIRSIQVSSAEKVSITPVTDNTAARETKYLLSYMDTQAQLGEDPNEYPNPGFGRIFNLEIPTADREFVAEGTLGMPNREDAVNVADAAVDAFLDALTATMVSPWGGTTFALQKMVVVGRNL